MVCRLNIQDDAQADTVEVMDGVVGVECRVRPRQMRYQITLRRGHLPGRAAR